MSTPYRTGAPATRESATLRFEAKTIPAESYDHSVIGHITFLGASMAAGALLATAFDVNPFWPAFVTTGAGFVGVFLWRARRQRRLGSVALRVVDDRLAIVWPTGSRYIPLTSIRHLSLRLDSQKAFAVRGHGIRATELPAYHGRARVVVCTDEEEIPLLALSGSQSECVEWIPPVNRLLRSCGWEPREAEAEEPAQPSSEVPSSEAGPPSG